MIQCGRSNRRPHIGGILQHGQHVGSCVFGGGDAREVKDCLVNTQEQRQLEDHRQTTRHRIGVVLFVECHRLLLQALRVFAVFALQFL